MIDDEFLAGFKLKTEARWRDQQLDPVIYGFQFQRGTRWNPGLTEKEISDYESALGVRFANDFRRMLQVMNGTDIPIMNIYGSSGESHHASVGVYSFPHDLAIVRDRIKDVQQNRDEIAAVLLDQGFELEANMGLVPIYIHRYLVCSVDPDESIVLSIHDGDAMVYATSLRIYLEKEFLK